MNKSAWEQPHASGLQAVSRPASNARSFSHTLTPLRPGQRFFARVRARNAEGESPWTSFFEVCTAPDAPATPGPPTLTLAAPDTITVTWKEPSPNGPPVMCYTVHFCCLGPIHDLTTRSGASRQPRHGRGVSRPLRAATGVSACRAMEHELDMTMPPHTLDLTTNSRHDMTADALGTPRSGAHPSARCPVRLL